MKKKTTPTYATIELTRQEMTDLLHMLYAEVFDHGNDTENNIAIVNSVQDIFQKTFFPQFNKKC